MGIGDILEIDVVWLRLRYVRREIKSR